MTRLLPIQLRLVNLAERVPLHALGYIDKETAYEELKEITGQDFGLDIEAWRVWYNTTQPEGPVEIPKFKPLLKRKRK